MNFNILLIKKIENILDMTNQFDKICADILEDPASEKNIPNIYNATSLYMLIRAEHGGIIILNDKMKNEIISSDTTLNDKTINKLYDLSTFTSIIENINNLVSNLDFQYKKLALMFPKFINKKPMDIILFNKSIDKNDKYNKLIEETKKYNKQNNFHVIQCTEVNKVINCNKMIGGSNNISIKVLELPSLYLINNDKIVELSVKHINSSQDLIKLLN